MVLDEQPDISDTSAGSDAVVSDGSIDFDHVYFKYNDRSESWNLPYHMTAMMVP